MFLHLVGLGVADRGGVVITRHAGDLDGRLSLSLRHLRVRTVTGNSAEDEEIMQDAFLALWERWYRVGAINDPTAYLYRTAMNLFRRRSRRAALALRRALSPAPDLAGYPVALGSR
jgi:DNA-directed RNA polymerase specialized sigma24 family protein